MSSPQLQDAAVEALAAIREPKAVPELRKIWESSNDLGWNAAAIRPSAGSARPTSRLGCWSWPATGGARWRPRP